MANAGDSGNKPQYEPSGTPVQVGKQMSSGLRERLKRSGRCYKSPSITPKRPLVKQIFTSPLLASPQSSIENAEHHRGSLACSSNETPTGKERSHGSSSRSKKCIDSSNPDSLRTMLYNRYGEEDSDHNDTLSMKSKELASSEQSTIEAKKKNSHCGESEPYTESQVSSQKLAFTNCEGEGKTFLPSPSCEKRNTGAKRQRSSSGEENQETVSLDRRKADLQQKITEKEEILRKLTMVKLYRTKNDLVQLQCLIDKWRKVSQEAVDDLHQAAAPPQPTLTELIDFLQLDHTLLGYNAEDESFT